jgi:menaquinone-dependent protoporphyrinogen oxidase
MKVLVCAASKYGATSEIAQAVADVLAERGCEVTVLPPEKVGAVEEFDAVVLGSAIYMGQWMKPARELAERSADAMASRPVWLFSSGPIGEPAKPADTPVDVTKILQASKARDHQIFTGKLAKKHLSFPDRAMASAIRAQEGDFRNWAQIRDWATGHRRRPAFLTSARERWCHQPTAAQDPDAARRSRHPHASRLRNRSELAILCGQPQRSCHL